MNFDLPPKKEMPSEYQRLVQAEIDKGSTPDQETAAKNVELALFNERIGQFKEEDLTQDADGSWHTFEQKVRDVFPEVAEDRFRGMKAAVTMHLCGQ